MTDRTVKNLPDSVRRRLLNLAKEQRVEFTYILIRYAIERLLYRLSVSNHADRFCLKGAILLSQWSEQPYRPTLDVDLLAKGDHTAQSITDVFAEVLAIECPEDAVTFKVDGLKLQQIRDGQEYKGWRLNFECELAQAVMPVQIDIGFGDAVTPGPVSLNYSTLLDMPAPVLNSYPCETVVAEKFEALVKLGMANTRMKDFGDLHYLASNFKFEGELLARAIRATFERRKTSIPSDLPIAFTEDFYGNGDKQKQWNAFVKKGKIDAPSLMVVCQLLREFLMPLCKAILLEESPPQSWLPLIGWAAD